MVGQGIHAGEAVLGEVERQAETGQCLLRVLNSIWRAFSKG